jgi:hypothetical protein
MFLALYFACTPDPVDSADTGEQEEIEYPEVTTCDVTEIRTEDEDPPHVGEGWTIFLWCDDALMTGASKVAVEPVDAATFDDSTGVIVVTWALAGDAVLSLQTGRFKATRDVTVLAAE